MRTVFVAGVLTGVALIVAGVFAFTRLGPGASGSSTQRPATSHQPQQEQPEIPDLTNYTPPPGCLLDRIYGKDGSVWSQFLDAPIRPIIVILEDGDQDIFPIDFYPIALNCHDSVQVANPYTPATPIIGQRCPGDTLVSRGGWVESDCYGRLRPDIPLIIGEGDRIHISPPLGPRGIIISEGPPIDR
ncbi:MAG: hypothetical protein HYS09_08975 [Chloroflexi bacterium]|nr:hypothetical protein [Chloroflexota bacterium]